ncbi:hypothetical protein QBC35DRAFT_450260 [Podospora australis]|uniref:Uncharacterized protein n=1 Tax=Podospora australis TaxID=1536484 RepID=A0AAN6X0T0_9PEZI|nr:hypothetical protein QBC35DRAFT_450260 [Podospora australis]
MTTPSEPDFHTKTQDYLGFYASSSISASNYKKSVVDEPRNPWSQTTASLCSDPATKTDPKLVPHWPRNPLPIQTCAYSTVVSVLGDVLLYCVWLALAAFAVAVARSHGVTRSSMTAFGDIDNLLSQARIVIPTLFPILYAATVGRCVRLISLYRVEQGERIGVLDRLVASTSFMGTLVAALTVSSARAIAPALFFIWALSPLGGQASFRSFHWQANMTETPRGFPYLSSNNSINIPDPSSDRDTNFFTSQSNSLLISSLISSANSTTSPMDLWGNAKIPAIESLMEYGIQSLDGWYSIEQGKTSTATKYSSLLGVPVQKRKALLGASKFALETSYWTLECLKVEYYSNARINSTSLPYHYSSNDTKALAVWTDRTNLNISAPPSATLTARRFVFGIGHWKSLMADCHIRTTYVETEVSCQRQACAASRMRISTKNHPPKNYTFLDDVSGTSPFLANLVGALPGPSNYSTLLSAYIGSMLGLENAYYDRKTGFRYTGSELYEALKTNAEAFSFILAQVLNTYWIAATGAGYVLDPEGMDYVENTKSHQYGLYIPPYDKLYVNFEKAVGSYWSEEPVFTCSVPWLVLLFIAILVSLVACILNLTLTGFLIRGPHLSMNFSTLTRDNPYIRIPLGGSALADYDRGKMLQDVRVRFGDVQGDAATGHVAIGTINTDDTNQAGVTKLGYDRGRLYD